MTLKTCLTASIVAVLMATSAHAADYTYRVNLLVGPSEPLYQGMEAMKQYVEKESDGRIEVQIFEGGQLGQQATLLLDLGDGQYDIAATSPAAMSAMLPAAGVFSAPYVFRGPEHMQAAMRSDVAQTVYDAFETETNIKVMDSWYYGTRNLTSNILGTTPEELSNVRMRIYEAPIAYEFAAALGTQPVVIAFPELYLALKTGTADAQENPIPTIWSQKFYEVQKYLIRTGHVVAPILPMMNADKWNALPDDLKPILAEGFQRGGEVNNGIVQDGESSLVAKLEDAGMQIVDIPDLAPFRARASANYAKHVEEWGDGTIEAIQAVKE